ncbi:EF_hand domain-containing protein [Hexamita inflata]|uniref:EF hand domain-containing protein n=1 Tax=Hexamita inflata TaxID=28002 RepID=A0AA86PUK3_9EUKA|nr:EF hand domain-containing protein [Hexamita inflata]
MDVNLYKYEQIFAELDYENKGYMTLDQLEEAVNDQMNLSINRLTLEYMLNIVDDNNDGVMQMDEFCSFLYICENSNYKDVKSILFYAADADYSGSIDKFEVLKISKKLKMSVTYEDVFRIVEELADNDDKSLSYSVFQDVMDRLDKLDQAQFQITTSENTYNTEQKQLDPDISLQNAQNQPEQLENGPISQNAKNITQKSEQITQDTKISKITNDTEKVKYFEPFDEAKLGKQNSLKLIPNFEPKLSRQQSMPGKTLKKLFTENDFISFI